VFARTNANNNESCPSEFGCVTNRLDHCALGVNRVAATEAILADCNDLASLKEDRNVIASCMLRRIASLLREHITIDMFLDPRGEHVRVVNLLIEAHPVSSLRKDVLHHGGVTVSPGGQVFWVHEGEVKTFDDNIVAHQEHLREISNYSIVEHVCAESTENILIRPRIFWLNSFG
jgi:hypothetical protein